ncbi:unnamed protein product [Amoebophrya sp. A120]|nr:unnamed protein product [Amoebophrya sp. A120]|eukprot:GSA120T00003837001.1
MLKIASLFLPLYGGGVVWQIQLSAFNIAVLAAEQEQPAESEAVLAQYLQKMIQAEREEQEREAQKEKLRMNTMGDNQQATYAGAALKSEDMQSGGAAKDDESKTSAGKTARNVRVPASSEVATKVDNAGSTSSQSSGGRGVSERQEVVARLPAEQQRPVAMAEKNDEMMAALLLQRLLGQQNENAQGTTPDEVQATPAGNFVPIVRRSGPGGAPMIGFPGAVEQQQEVPQPREPAQGQHQQTAQEAQEQRAPEEVFVVTQQGQPPRVIVMRPPSPDGRSGGASSAARAPMPAASPAPVRKHEDSPQDENQELLAKLLAELSQSGGGSDAAEHEDAASVPGSHYAGSGGMGHPQGGRSGEKQQPNGQAKRSQESAPVVAAKSSGVGEQEPDQALSALLAPLLADGPPGAPADEQKQDGAHAEEEDEAQAQGSTEREQQSKTHPTSSAPAASPQEQLQLAEALANLGLLTGAGAAAAEPAEGGGASAQGVRQRRPNTKNTDARIESAPTGASEQEEQQAEGEPEAQPESSSTPEQQQDSTTASSVQAAPAAAPVDQQSSAQRSSDHDVGQQLLALLKERGLLLPEAAGSAVDAPSPAAPSSDAQAASAFLQLLQEALLAGGSVRVLTPDEKEFHQDEAASKAESKEHVAEGFNLDSITECGPGLACPGQEEAEPKPARKTDSFLQMNVGGSGDAAVAPAAGGGDAAVAPAAGGGGRSKGGLRIIRLQRRSRDPSQGGVLPQQDPSSDSGNQAAMPSKDFSEQERMAEEENFAVNNEERGASSKGPPRDDPSQTQITNPASANNNPPQLLASEQSTMTDTRDAAQQATQQPATASVSQEHDSQHANPAQNAYENYTPTNAAQRGGDSTASTAASQEPQPSSQPPDPYAWYNNEIQAQQTGKRNLPKLPAMEALEDRLHELEYEQTARQGRWPYTEWIYNGIKSAVLGLGNLPTLIRDYFYGENSSGNENGGNPDSAAVGSSSASSNDNENQQQVRGSSSTTTGAQNENFAANSYDQQSMAPNFYPASQSSYNSYAPQQNTVPSAPSDKKSSAFAQLEHPGVQRSFGSMLPTNFLELEHVNLHKKRNGARELVSFQEQLQHLQELEEQFYPASGTTTSESLQVKPAPAKTKRRHRGHYSSGGGMSARRNSNHAAVSEVAVFVPPEVDATERAARASSVRHAEEESFSLLEQPGSGLSQTDELMKMFAVSNRNATNGTAGANATADDSFSIPTSTDEAEEFLDTWFGKLVLGLGITGGGVSLTALIAVYTCYSRVAWLIPYLCYPFRCLYCLCQCCCSTGGEKEQAGAQEDGPVEEV